MPKDIHVPARIIGGKIPCKATLGQTVIVTEGPDTYTGPTTVTPSESEQILLTKDKLVTDNVTVNPIPSEYTDAKADYEDALTAFGVEDSLADGISALTEYSNEITGEADENLSDAVRSLADMAVEEWDGILYPADEEGRFNCKWLYLETGDKVVVEWKGTQRQWTFEKTSGIYKPANRGENGVVMSLQQKNADGQLVYPLMRLEFEPVAGPCLLIIAGYSGVPDGTHSGNDGYVFFGEYFKYKVIRAS
jgi:hypothetical protein